MDKQERFPCSLWDDQQTGKRINGCGREETERVFTLNFDQLQGPGGVFVCECVSHRAQTHLPSSQHNWSFSVARKNRKAQLSST